MAISAGMALLSTATTAIGVAGGTATFLGIGTAGWLAGSFASHFLITTALGAALNALTPKPSSGSTSRGYQVTSTGTVLPMQVIYGEVKTAGAEVYRNSTGGNNSYFHRVLAFTSHEIDAWTSLYFNDEELTIDGSGNVTSPSRYNGHVRINLHNGSPDQVADSDLVSEVPEWTAEHRLQGIAYAYIRLKFNADVFPNGVPEVTAKIKGKRVYDPRSDTTVWSDNPALCLRDYLTSNPVSDGHGLGAEVVNVDDTLVISSADVCDQLTDDGSTRYTCNGNYLTNTTPYDFLNGFLTCMGGLLWYSQGKWRMKPAYWTEPTLTFDENDLRSSIKVQTRRSRRDNFNKVNGTFRGEESNWQVDDFPAVTNSVFVSADGGQESSVDIDFPFTDTSLEARRLSRVILERNRQQLVVEASFSMKAFQVQVGDNVYLDNTRFGWSNKPFEILSWTFGIQDQYGLVVNLTLQETAESVFDEVDDGLIYERDNTNLLSPFDVPTVGVTLEAEAQVLAEKLLNSLRITTTSSEYERIDYVEVQYKESTQSKYRSAGTGELGEFFVSDLSKANHDVRARAVNTFGIKGEWTIVSDFFVDALKAPPADVTGFTKALNGGAMFLYWEPVPDLDLSYYEVRHSSLTSGATWGSSYPLVTKVARPATSVSTPALSGTILIKAWDKSGNPSVNATTLLVQGSELPPLGNSQELTDSPTFTGTKDNVVIDTTPNPDELVVDDLTGTGIKGTYYSSTYLDTGSNRNCRVSSDVEANRHYPDGGLWDAIPQNWDTWPDTFDSWTAEQSGFNDYSVAVEVRATPDDPAGTPTWGSWVPATGTIVGRAFEFRAKLSGSNDGVSPSIETLTFRVEY